MPNADGIGFVVAKSGWWLADVGFFIAKYGWWRANCCQIQMAEGSLLPNPDGSGVFVAQCPKEDKLGQAPAHAGSLRPLGPFERGGGLLEMIN